MIKKMTHIFIQINKLEISNVKKNIKNISLLIEMISFFHTFQCTLHKLI